MPKPERITMGQSPVIAAEADMRRDHPRGLCRVLVSHWVVHLYHVGSGQIRCGEAFQPVGPGDLALFPPGSVQWFRTDPRSPDWRWLWVAFRDTPQLGPLLDWPDAGGDVRRVYLPPGPLRREVRLTFDQILQAFLGHSPPRHASYCINLVERLLLWAEMANPLAQYGQVDPRIRQALVYMDFHYRQRLTVEQLAAQAHLSPSRFAHLFRQEVGTSPMRHLEQVRLQQARRLLASTHLTVSEVADVLGYCNVFHFSKVFRDHVGQPPSQFRQQHEPQIAPADQPRDA